MLIGCRSSLRGASPHALAFGAVYAKKYRTAVPILRSAHTGRRYGHAENPTVYEKRQVKTSIIMLNDPKTLNALSPGVVESISNIIARRDSTEVVIIRSLLSDINVFSSGGNLKGWIAVG